MIHTFYKALKALCTDISPALLEIKLRFCIYVSYTHLFSFTCCLFPVAAAYLSLLAWKRSHFAAVVFPVVFPPCVSPRAPSVPQAALGVGLCGSPGLRQLPPALACTSLDLACLPVTLVPVLILPARVRPQSS